MVRDYIKPRSLTWWMGVAMVISGIFEIAGVNYSSSAVLRTALDEFYGTLGPGARINFGLALIGLRKAMGE